jgi:hypothetical protein
MIFEFTAYTATPFLHHLMIFDLHPHQLAPVFPETFISRADNRGASKDRGEVSLLDLLANIVRGLSYKSSSMGDARTHRGHISFSYVTLYNTWVNRGETIPSPEL